MKKHILYIATIIAGTFIATPVFATTMDTNVNIRPSMTLSVSSNDINLNLNPATKPFDTKDLTITIGTNNPTGYKLYLTSDSTNLINTEDNTKTIETLPSSTPATGYDQSSFPANYWGYRKSNGSSSSGNYLPFSSDLLVSSATGPSNETTTSIGLASKIDYLKESGTYSLDFKLNAIPTITQYYMQDLSDPTLASSVCVTEHPTIVFDSRDEQAYMIQRLPDNRCWMLDNLNLDLTSRSVVANITTINTNADEASLKSLKEGNRSAGSQYATAGLSYENWTTQANSYTTPLANRGGKCDPEINSTAACQPPYQGQNYTYNTKITVNNPGYGSYKIGTYYNYCATSAGSYCYDADNGVGNSQYDICPSGWKIPADGTENGEFHTLCTLLNNGKSCTSPQTMSASSPLSMQYLLSATGFGEYINRSASGQGAYTWYWTSSFSNPSRMGMMLITNTEVRTTGSNHTRVYSKPVRCLLKES